MHIVTIVGDCFSGKTALCEQWMGRPYTSTYITTIELTYYQLPLLTLHDTPSIERFTLDSWYASSDIIVLMASKDAVTDSWYLRISALHPSVPWVLILNGPGSFVLRRRWALSRDIRVFQLNTETGEGVAESLTHLRECLEDLPRSPDRFTLVDYVVQFIPTTCV